VQYYTYLHLRGDSRIPFYVGKGRHKRAWDKRHRNPHWHGVVNKVGYEVQVVKRFADEAMAFECERLLIRCYREVGIELANYTDGGDGPSGLKHSEETRRRLSQIARDRARNHPNRDEWIAKISASRKGSNNRPKGYRQKPETIEKISAAMKGRVFSDEHRRNLSESKRAKGRRR
jgi:hypothetical protein